MTKWILLLGLFLVGCTKPPVKAPRVTDDELSEKEPVKAIKPDRPMKLCFWYKNTEAYGLAIVDRDPKSMSLDELEATSIELEHSNAFKAKCKPLTKADGLPNL